METSQTIGKLSTALAKAQGEIRGATKDSTNPHFRSKYADMASVRDAIQDALSKHGIAYVQFPEGGPETVTITTVLTCGEEWMRASYSMRPVKSDPQGMGSAITYARRYALMAAVGVAPEDDDGNAASRPNNGSGSDPNQTGSRGSWRHEYASMYSELHACGDEDTALAWWNSRDTQEFVKRANEHHFAKGGIDYGSLLENEYMALQPKLKKAQRNPMKEQDAAQSRADVVPEDVLSAGGPPAPSDERMSEATARILDRIDLAETVSDLDAVVAGAKNAPEAEKPIIRKAYKQRKQTIAQKEAA